MFTVEVTYPTVLGSMPAYMTTSQTVRTREEADELRDTLEAMQIADAVIMIKSAKPLPTTDEAMQSFRKHFAEYLPTVKIVRS
jgi:hypothetical protein